MFFGDVENGVGSVVGGEGEVESPETRRGHGTHHLASWGPGRPGTHLLDLGDHSLRLG